MASWIYPASSDSGDNNNVFLSPGISAYVAPQVSISSNALALYGAGPDHQVIIAGSVSGNKAVQLGSSSIDDGSYLEVRNTGHVFSGDGTAVDLIGESTQLLNNGTIESFDTGVEVEANSDSGIGILRNAGTISGSQTAITNRGTSSENEELDIYNSGTIESDHNAIMGSDGTVKVTNTGVIAGAISFGAGSDLYDGRNGTISGTVYGGGGVDTIYGGKEEDRLDGGADNDYLNGGDGNDTLIGGAGADTLVGGAGSNTASYATSTAGVKVNMLAMASNTGDAAGDTFSGIQNILATNYVDGISGDNNANIINTANGNDFIYGAGGADRLTGGAGADTFIYKARADSSVSTFDTITDFSEAQHDKINLSLIDANINTAANDAFVFIGTSAFTGAADQLRYVTSTSGTDIFADTNGDKVADFKIHLATAQTLQAGDFIL